MEPLIRIAPTNGRHVKQVVWHHVADRQVDDEASDALRIPDPVRMHMQHDEMHDRIC